MDSGNGGESKFGVLKTLGTRVDLPENSQNTDPSIEFTALGKYMNLRTSMRVQIWNWSLDL